MASNIVGPAIAVAVIGFSIRAGFDPEKIHFTIQRQKFRAQIPGALAESTEFRVWHWGFKGGGIVSVEERCVVFDPSGEMLLSPQNRSVEWFRKADQAAENAKLVSGRAFYPDTHDYYAKHVNVRDIGQGFYIVTDYF